MNHWERMLGQAEQVMDAAALLSAIVNNSDDAIVGKTLDGTVISWNAAAERIFGYSAEEMIGRSIRTLIPPDRQAEEDGILATIGAGEHVPTFETERRRRDGSLVDVAITVSPVRNAAGQIVAASKIARDITERVAFRRQIEERESEFRMLADNMAQLSWIAGPDGAMTWYNQRWYDYTGTTEDEMRGWGWMKVHRADLIEGIAKRFRDSVETGQPWEDTFPLRGADGEYRWFLSRAVPIRDAAGQVSRWFGTNTDITDRLDAQRRIELLLMEVDHRSRNLLAVVQSLVRQTVASGGNVIERLEQRIAALSANQDLLVQRAWANVPVRELVAAQMKLLGDLTDRVSLDGPDLTITPAAAEPVAMAMHEMAINALKYGALSVPGGRIAICWSVDRLPGAEPQFRISWTESEGPPVAAPERAGFGSRIIRDVPRAKLRGEVSLDFAPDGFRWELTCPAAHVTA